MPARHNYGENFRTFYRKKEFPSAFQEIVLYGGGEQTLEQFAGRGSGFYPLGDIQKPSGLSYGQAALCGPASAGGLGQMTSRGPL